MNNKPNNLILHSEIGVDAVLRLRLQELPLIPLAAGEVRIRMEAAPVNPSDMGLLLASADLSTARLTGDGNGSVMTAELPNRRFGPYERRVGLRLPVGNEGTGTVVDAAPDVRHMIGQTVAVFGGAMYARYRTIAGHDCLVVPSATPASARAGLFVNPLTALAMVETMRMEGHRALVHNAAASNLGQMLVKICAADGIDLVNIVRGADQVALLKALGARRIVDSRAVDFKEQLTREISETRATIAFDPVGGGRMANILLHAMDASEHRFSSSYSLYGSDSLKQIYIYGSLDQSETVLDRGYGLAWSVSALLVMHFLKKAGPQVKAHMLERIAREHDTTFASHFSAEVGLADLLRPEILRKLVQKKTGDKYLVRFDPDTEGGEPAATRGRLET
ncbi:MAG: NADH oxidase [Alphaproteobacteria bacterium]|nr:MAG: NADH oxidase [Alphaproteobacteria bacterium]